MLATFSYKIRIEVSHRATGDTFEITFLPVRSELIQKPYGTSCLLHYFRRISNIVRADEKLLYAILEIDSVSMYISIFDIWVDASHVIFNVI